MVIKVGCINDDGKTNAEYVPDVEIFTRSRVPWMAPVDGAKRRLLTLLRFERWLCCCMKGFRRTDMLWCTQRDK